MVLLLWDWEIVWNTFGLQFVPLMMQSSLSERRRFWSKV
jgi:hypothetical protein